jgi:ribosome modulation factor
MDPVMENLQSHLAYQECLERDGIHVCCWTTLDKRRATLGGWDNRTNSTRAMEIRLG